MNSTVAAIRAVSTIAVALVAGLLAADSAAGAGGRPTARQIVDRAWWAAKLEGAEMTSTLIITDARGQRRVRKTASISKLFDHGKTEKRLIRFLAPADVKGTGLLTFDYENNDDDVWLFLPSLRKTRRIVSSDKARSFMGSEFTYADITPPSPDDFGFKLLGTKKADGVDCWVIEAVPKTRAVAEDNGYKKRVAWFGKDDLVVRRATTHDLKGRLHKKLEASQVKPVEGSKGGRRHWAMKMTMVNVQNKHTSTLIIDEIKLRSEIPDDYFTVRYLERR